MVGRAEGGWGEGRVVEDQAEGRSLGLNLALAWSTSQGGGDKVWCCWTAVLLALPEESMDGGDVLKQGKAWCVGACGVLVAVVGVAAVVEVGGASRGRI